MQDERVTVPRLIATGFVLVLPAVLAGIVIGRIYSFLGSLLQPLLDVLPGTAFRSPSVRAVAVVVGIVLLLLGVGLLARTVRGKAIGRWLEKTFLRHLPLYNVLRSLAWTLGAREEGESMTAALLEIGPGVRQFGLIVDRHPDGSVTVFLPESPNPAVGTLFVLDASLVTELRVPARSVVSCFPRWGYGTADVLQQDRDLRTREDPT